MPDFVARFAAACALALGAVASAQDAAEPRPNFVVILCDDLGYGDLGCFGHPTIKSPNLDKLAAEGLRLTDCYASAPVCSPSRAGMLTGRTPHRLGIYDWIPAGSPMHLQSKEITVASILKQAGYATWHVGKWHCNGKFNSPDQPQPGDHGFVHWMSTQNNAGPSHRNPVNFVRNGKPVGPITGYSSALIVDEAISLLSARKADQPFGLFVWFHSPHEPVATAEEFVKPYAAVAKTADEAEYFGNVTQTDHEIGRLLRKLDEIGARDNTLVFFTSDNGPETLNRYKTANRSYGTPGPLRGMKLHLYEGGIRVPGIVRFPGRVKAGTVSAEPVINLDVLPTLCAPAGRPVPADRAIDGADISPIFAGRPITRKTPLYWRYDKALGWPKEAMRDGDWKLLTDAAAGRFELYNLRADVAEKNDLSAKEPERVKAMAAALAELHRQVATEAPRWPAVPKAKTKAGEKD
jgi:arylsulfatase A